jgi:two-component system response regulator CssR
VEDEINLNNLIKSYLERENYEVVNFYNGEDAIDHIGDEIHLWILDIMLGDSISGYDIIKKIREINKNVPVIFTSARDQDLDKIIGLELGSDDYITKPYSPKELVLRVNNIIKRVYMHSSDKIHYEAYDIDVDKRMDKLPNTEYRMEIRKLVKKEVEKNIDYVKDKINEYNLHGYSFYIYTLPFTNLQDTRKQIIKDLKEV